MKIKNLNKSQVGPRIIVCPFCKNRSVHFELVTNSKGKAHQRFICYNILCNKEFYK